MTQEIKNYAEFREKLLEGVDSSKQNMMGILLDNSHKEMSAVADGHNKLLVESSATGSTLTGNISRYDMMFLPLVRRTMPALLATDLVGVQALKSSRGIVRTIKARYSEDTDAGAGTEAVVAGTEASGEAVYEKYSKLALGADYDAVDALDPFAQTQHLESNRGKPMDIQVVTDSVDTMSRKLSAAWSLESQDDLNAFDNLDMETELTSVVGDEIIREQDRELVTELENLAGTVRAFDFANADGRYAGEKLAALTIFIDSLSDEIARLTKRSGATWMVISQPIFTGLKNASNGAFIPANGGELQITTTLFVGTIGRIKVYVDPYATGDSVLMGYKGDNEIDTGLVFCPYIPLSSSGAVRNVETGDFRVMLRTRYGFYKRTDPLKSLGDSSNYYARANVANLALGFKN